MHNKPSLIISLEVHSKPRLKLKLKLNKKILNKPKIYSELKTWYRVVCLISLTNKPIKIYFKIILHLNLQLKPQFLINKILQIKESSLLAKHKISILITLNNKTASL
jgi:hypothetical protein